MQGSKNRPPSGHLRLKNRPPSGHLRLKNRVWRVKKSIQEAAVDKALKTVYWLAKEVAGMKFPSLMQLLTMFGDPDVHHLRAEDPTRRGMSLTCESSQFFYYQLAILLCKV